MSVPYAEDADFTTNGTKRSNHTNLKNLRLKQPSTKDHYECIPRWTRRAHAKLAAADKSAVTDETLIFALYLPSSKILGGWLGDEFDFARYRSARKAAAAVGVPKDRFNSLLAKTLKPYYPGLLPRVL